MPVVANELSFVRYISSVGDCILPGCYQSSPAQKNGEDFQTILHGAGLAGLERHFMTKRVLVVDDDQNTVTYLSVVLSENGYDPIPAYDGSEGLQKIKQDKPDLIILDVMMPKKSGLVLFKQLKRDEQFKDIPILMLTGVSGIIEEMEDHKDETFEKPYDNLREALKRAIRGMREDGLIKPEMFVDKPVDPEAFVARVRQLIGS